MKISRVKCFECKTFFRKESKKVKYNRARDFKNYCSRVCQSKAKVVSITLKCATCNKDVRRTPSAIKKSKSGRSFCDKHCATIYNNTAYKSGKNNPNYTVGRNYREKALKHYPHKCVKCNYSRTEILQVDHIDSNRDNNDINNLQILCPTHHWEKTLGIA